MKKAFTLIELLVVVLIIGTLSAIALPQYQRAVLRSRFTEIEINLRALYQAEQRYYLANGSYATNLSNLDIEIPTCKCLSGVCETCEYIATEGRHVVGTMSSAGKVPFSIVLDEDYSNCTGVVRKGVLYGHESQGVSESLAKALGFADAHTCGTGYRDFARP